MVHLPPWGPPSLGAVLVCLFLQTLAALPATASSSGTPVGSSGMDGSVLRVVVWEAHAGDGPFLSRLRGQTVDLSVELVNSTAAAGEAAVGSEVPSPLDRQVAIAEELAARHAARVVTWRAGDEVLVLLATPAPPRLLVRRIGAGTGSAHLESAALIVRGALLAVLEGGTFGIARAESPSPAQPPAPAEIPASTANASQWTAFVLADFRMASDGVGHSSPKGFGAHVGLGWWRLAAGGTGMFTLDRDVGTAIHQAFWRHNAAVFVAVDVLERGRAHLIAEVQGGVATFNLYRSSGTVHRSFLLIGAELRASFAAARWGRIAVPLWGAVGVDYIPNAPPLRLTTDGPILWATHELQPRVMFGTGVSF